MKKLATIKRTERVDIWSTALMVLMFVHTGVATLNTALEGNVAIRSCFVDTMVEFRGIRRVSQKRFHDSTPRFPPLAPVG